MPVIVLEARDFTSPLFLVRTLEVLSSCTTFSLVASLESSELNKNSSHSQHVNTFRIFCMFTWCFFFTLTLLIHILSVIQFHSLLPISWKNLTVTVAVLGALMCLSTSFIFPWMVMNQLKMSPRPVIATVAACLTFLAYSAESYILRTQTHEQRGYMGSMPGFLKILQLWGSCQTIPLIVETSHLHPKEALWQQWVSGVSYSVCIFMSLIILVVILGDFAGRCLLPFDKFLAGFSMTGVLFYIVATVICFTKILQAKGPRQSHNSVDLVIVETVLVSVTLLSYTVDLAFSIKLLCDRSHT
ncbi:myeloid-associated differentiation marker homolog [Anabas testudineus]|uniref:MARVEL domain-containing protein n=1 Tax=Anabas testudineus TaxID=64144 RepID=A0A3Q1JSD4_ANATE|nr:myeloid-associated differentiation marker homolog [Anabas testudineus]